jgi:CRISPR-associated protein Cas1
MKTHLNTLYVTTQGAYVVKEGETVQVRVERKVRAQFPLHKLEGIVCFGRVGCSPALLGACAEKGVAVSLFTEHGRFLASVRGFSHGNVLVRRRQYRLADDPTTALDVARRIVLAKVANSRSVLLRGARDARGDPERVATLGAVCGPPRGLGPRSARRHDPRRRSRLGRRGGHALFQRVRSSPEQCLLC